MRAVIQRVNNAKVTIENTIYAEIKIGLLVLLGITNDDTIEDYAWLAKKICQMRLFDDENGVMNNSLLDINGEIMLVSQFTLMAKTKKGNRPSYISAAKPDTAIPIYEKTIEEFKTYTPKIKTGSFGADMQISLTNSGPVTIILDTKNKT